MTSRFHQCRCAQGATRGDALPFALPGARATFAPARDVDVRHLRIEVALDFATASVDGVCTLTLAAINDGPAQVALDAVELTIHAVELAGKPLSFTYDNQQLRF